MSKPQQPARKSARDAFTQSQAYADQIPQCRELLDEVERGFTNANTAPGLRLLAQAIRGWLGDKTMSVLIRKKVAMKVGRGYEWLDLFENPTLEADRSRHSSVSRWLNGEARWPFSQETARRWAWCSIQHQFWQPSLGKRRPLMRHEYFHQLLEQLDSNATTRGNLASEAPGLYQIFRPSIIYPGRYVFGLFAVALMPDEPRYPHEGQGQWDADNRYAYVLRTIELHRIGGEMRQSDAVPEFSQDGIAATPRVEEVFRGYMVKKSRQVLVHAFDSVTGSFQYSVISNFLLSESVPDNPALTLHPPRREAARMQMMSGIAVGLVGQLGFYSVPTVMLRVADIDHAACNTDEQLIGQLRNMPGHDAVGILPAERIPEFVLRQFQVIERQVVLHTP